MRLRFAVLRPEPGNAATVARLAGHNVLRLPLFGIMPLAWDVPDLAGIDALLVTSANSMRHGGAGLASLRHLPVIAVGAATAKAAAAAGFTVEAVGEGDARDAARRAEGRGLLHLTGRDHVGLPGVPVVATYAAEPIYVSAAGLSDLAGRTALLHSPRAAARLATLIASPVRANIALAALSPAVAAAAGAGWRAVVVAPQPSDAALVMCAIDRARGRGDNADHD